MTNRLTSIIAVSLALVGAAARADGLIYRLPADGAWVRYDAIAVFDQDAQPSEVTGKLVIRSVGQVTVNDQKHRWIEIRIVLESPGWNQVTKLLIPEARLKKGHAPIKHVLRAWHQVAKREIKSLKLPVESGYEAVHAMLGGPLQNRKKLEKKEEVQWQKGNLQCEVLTGSLPFFKNRINDLYVKQRIRLHETVPFGVAAATFEFWDKQDGKHTRVGTMNFWLSAMGKDAKSELPDSK